MRIIFFRVAFRLAAGLICLAAIATANAKPAPRLIVLTQAFTQFFDATAQLPEAKRIKQFRTQFATVLPGFYAPRLRTEAGYEKQIAFSLQTFPGIRAKYEQVARDFPKAFTQGQQSFRRSFPDYRLDVPVYLLHSLNEMDGGTRDLDGKVVGIFGADVIARIHSPATLKPFLDHELFHLYHQRFFPDCDALWCSLWQEGLAVYVAAKLNPGATDEGLLLTQPRPIRGEVEPRLKEAMCGLGAKLESTRQEDYAPFFFGRANDGPFPPRYGYLLGYLLASKIGEGMTLDQLAKLPPDKVKPALVGALAAYGNCS
jgi:hypothetical protein